MFMLLESANATLLCHRLCHFFVRRCLFMITVGIQYDELWLYIKLIEMIIACGNPVPNLISTFVLLSLLLTFKFQVS